MSETEYPIRNLKIPDRMFKVASEREWFAAHPAHRWSRIDGKTKEQVLYISDRCSLCPDHEVSSANG